MSQRLHTDEVDVRAAFDREIQTFVFMFLPSLFEDLTDRIDEGFTAPQIHAVNIYFQKAITLTAIAYPHRLLLFIGDPTYRSVRKLHKRFVRWCKACDAKDIPVAKKEKMLDDMQDALWKLSRNYGVARTLRLTPEKQRLLLVLFGSMHDAVKGLTNIGLESLNRFVERTLDENIEFDKSSENETPNE